MRLFIALFFPFVTVVAQSTAVLTRATDPHVLSDPLRDPWQKPDQVINALNFSASETVAVIENGYPYFAPRIAPLVKKVYAVNADPRAFQGRGQLPSAITPVVGRFGNPNIAGLKTDTVMMVDMLRFLPQRPLYYLGIAAGLNPGGRLVIIDRRLPPAFPASQQVTDLSLQNELPGAGFGFLQQSNILPYQFFLVFHHL